MSVAARPIGLGCMRLSELGDEARAIATIHAALDEGAMLLDTADAYGASDRDAHGNERLIARALAVWKAGWRAGWSAGWSGGARPTIVTKGGLVREGAKWVPDGRAAHLRDACERSRDALGVDAIDLYLLHAVDPRTPLETSVRALVALRESGAVRAIGLSNVTLRELDRALEIAPIECVEISLSPHDDEALRGGLIERCAERGIRVLAHSPLGGPRRAGKLARDATLAAIGRERGASAAEIAIAWLRDLHEVIVPIPGARSIESARSAVRAASIVLEDRDRSRLDRRFPAGARMRGAVRFARRASPRPADDAPGDVRVLMGMQGAGKSTLARALEAEGYVRLNRDERGGTLRALVRALDALLAEGVRRVVLDNTYATRAARDEVLEVAWRHGVPARCTWIDAPLEVAQANVARRIVATHGRLLGPNELLAASEDDPGVVPPLALARYRRELEPPSAEEGFATIEVRGFERAPELERDRGGVLVAQELLDRDDVLGELRTALARGDAIAALAWIPDARARDAALARLAAAERALGASIDLRACAHPAGPPICWCRPPLPGLAVEWIEQHRLAPARVVVLSDRPAHRTLADAVGATAAPL